MLELGNRVMWPAQGPGSTPDAPSVKPHGMPRSRRRCHYLYLRVTSVACLTDCQNSVHVLAMMSYAWHDELTVCYTENAEMPWGVRVLT